MIDWRQCRYNAGDVVHVRDDLSMYRNYHDEIGNRMSACHQMVAEFAGKDVTIKASTKSQWSDTMCYLLLEDTSHENDGDGWYFVAEMFAGYAEAPGSPLADEDLMSILDL